MLRFFVILFFISIYSNCFSQHTDTFQNIATELINPQKTNEIKYFNGGTQPKEITNYYVYQIDGRSYKVKTGENKSYYKNGQILFDSKYDDYGNLLICRKLDDKGRIIDEFEAYKIDISKEATPLDILTSIKTTIFYHQKYFKTKNGKQYLQKEGNKINNKREGTWKTYDDSGKIIETKVY
ncbi:MAG: hypothetical protein WBA59_01275 [Moheibacter sp.]